MRNDFAVMIISHERPECRTHKVIRDCGYTGKIYVVCDDKDKKLGEYVKKYPKELHVFTKEIKDYDSLMDNNIEPLGIATFARNECIDFAKSIGLKYILMIDDDLKSLTFRYPDNGKLKSKRISHFDEILELCIGFLDSQNGTNGLSFGLVFDYMGGLGGGYQITENFSYNSYLLRVRDTPHFRGRYNEDAIFNIENLNQGSRTLVLKLIQADFSVFGYKGTEDKEQLGGCIEAYRSIPWYTKNFYPVMHSPSTRSLELCTDDVKLRLDRKDKVFPKIIREEYKRVHIC